VSIRVLVVEDEPTVRSLAGDVLADAGFETAEASNAAQALELLKNSEDDIDVLFTECRAAWMDWS
jgi:CheY-like chemotaxis protein